jgi:hypothetical protein
MFDKLLQDLFIQTDWREKKKQNLIPLYANDRKLS